MHTSIALATALHVAELLEIEKQVENRPYNIPIIDFRELCDAVSSGVCFRIVVRRRISKTAGLILFELTKRPGWHIREFAIAPEFQGNGIGQYALELALEGFRGPCVYLHTHPENDCAIHIYEKCGFKREKIVVCKAYGERLVMSRHLD
jgi:ribosomal protein S18 acetylase RimI-like enzyme